MTSASTIGRPAIISKPCAPLSVPNVIAKNAPANPAMPADSENTDELGLEDVHADRHRRGLAVAQRDESSPERAAPERDDTDPA